MVFFFFSEYLILKQIKGTLSHADVAQFQIIVENITANDGDLNKVKGLYDRGAGESLNGDKAQIRKISHDNITAISAFSRLLEDEGLSYHKDIAKHGLSRFMCFDNACPDKPRLIFKKPDGKWDTSFQYHPRDWFFWLNSAGYKISWLFFPIFFFANIITCLTPHGETSGKWLMFTRLEAGSKWSKLMNLNKKICYWLLKRKYGAEFINEISKIYFWQKSDSPIRTLSKGIDYDQLG